MDKHTLFVVHATRMSRYVIEDMIATISWSCSGRPYKILLVDNQETCRGLDVEHNNVIVTQPELSKDALPGFHCLAGLRTYIAGASERLDTLLQVIMLSDECLIIQPGIDTFFGQHTTHPSFGVAGVGTTRDAGPVWSREFDNMMQCGFNIAAQECPNTSLCDDILIMSFHFVAVLNMLTLAVPPNCENWSGTFGDYISWVCYLNQKRVIKWGYDTQILPPLCVVPVTGMFVPPHFLNERIGIIAPANRFLGYDESAIRELYKRSRGEAFREIPKLSPVIVSTLDSDK